jgi:RimJ/RimL family protein N-acetyltransferase
LRGWKNDHRESFFFKGIIAPADQVKWFQGYLGRSHDYMFVVLFNGRALGCLGFRYIEQGVDIYNVILGIPEMRQKGLMGKALRMMCSYAQKEYPGAQGAKVLRSNPAVGWYQRNGFKIARFHEDHVDIELDQVTFKPCRLITSSFTDS